MSSYQLLVEPGIGCLRAVCLYGHAVYAETSSTAVPTDRRKRHAASEAVSVRYRCRVSSPWPELPLSNLLTGFAQISRARTPVVALTVFFQIE